MPEFATELLRKEYVAEATMAFHFRKPAGFEFRAGQAIDLTLIDPPESDAEGNTRAFSLASAPRDADLMIATRLRNSAFKRVLQAADPGLPLKFDGPSGSLTLHKNAAKPAVFLAGGIGITPFRSMARQAAFEHLPHRITLFYSNRAPQHAAFLGELQQMPQQNPHFQLVATMTDLRAPGPEWDGETGLLTTDTLRKHLENVNGPIYYIAGPPAMVSALRELLVASGIDEDDIRTEDFVGY